MTPLVLAGLAVLLAGPIPAVLGLMPALRRTPRAAMLLWQAVAAAAVLAALGSGLALLSEPWRQHRGLTDGLASGLSEGIVVGVAALVTAVVLGRLLLSGHLVGTRLRSVRRRHRDLLDLLATSESGVDVLDHDTPTAYCLPGLARPRVVLSSGALAALDHDQLRAVLAHERAHLRARHDLVVEAFTVLQRAFPAVVTSARALAEVRLLIEVLADRAARRVVGPRPVIEALDRLVATVPRGAVAAGGVGADRGVVAVRTMLLGDVAGHRIQALLVMAAAIAVLVLPTALVVFPWWADLRY